MSNLQILILGFHSPITDDGIKNINLKRLYCSKNKDITKHAAKRVSRFAWYFMWN